MASSTQLSSCMVPAAIRFLPGDAAETEERSWFALYTCANHEKRVAAQFSLRGIEHFLPLYTSVRRWSDRKMQIEAPLFPGYLFVRIIRDARVRALEVPGVVRMIAFGGQPHALPENEIEALRRGLAGKLLIEPFPFLRAGCRVRIKHGPLGGVEGLLVRKKGRFRVVLSLDVIAKSAAVEVDAADVERL